MINHLSRLWLHPAFKPLKIEISRYTIVGVANALLTVAIFFSLLKILHLNYLFSLFCSWFFGVIFSYCMNFVWVFSQPDKITFDARFIKFVSSGLFSIGLNLIALRLLVETTGYDPFWVQTMLMPVIVAFNFLAAKFWALARVYG